MFCLICTQINGWVKNGEAGDLRRYRAHYDVTVMSFEIEIDYTITDSMNIVVKCEMKFGNSKW